MSYSECLTLFTNWPHDSPSPEDLANARCSLQSASKELDMVICQVCNTCLWDMEPDDGPKVEHYRRSRSILRFESKTDPTLIFFQHTMASPPKCSQASPPQVSPKAPQPSPKGIGFLDSSLQHNFPELCLSHNAHTFCDHIERCRSQFDEADILTPLPKGLRGEALKTFNQSEHQDLAVCLGL